MNSDPQTQQLIRTGLQHHQAGRLREAEALYRQALQRQPNDPDALHYLGLLAQQVGKIDASLWFLEQSLKLRPDNPAFHINLAIVLQQVGRFDEAITHCRQAIALRPDLAEGHANLGAVFTSSGNPEGAIEHLRRALELEAGNLKARYNLGDALAKSGQDEQAIAVFQQVIAAQPNHANAHFAMGMSLLRSGEFARGWPEYEWRWRTGDPSIPRREFSQPLWDGGTLSGKTILLYSEQGYGDAIQFIRFLPMVLARGGKVVLECLPGLVPLFAQLQGLEQVIAWGDPLPPFDVRCPLMTLPSVLGTTLQTIPSNVPYFRAPAPRASIWRGRLAEESGFKVGLAWSGNPRHSNDRQRSLPASMLGPLANIPGVSFYSLQKREPGTAPQNPPFPIRDLTDDLNDFADTAALIDGLDLVISVDTAVAHLGGAMGRPVWLLLPFVADWRWVRDREDSPWYPAMRLFRQPQARDWESVIKRVAAKLRTRIATAQETENRPPT